MRAKISAIKASTWQICIIAVALIVMTTCSAFAGKAITRIDVTNTLDRTVITVQGNESLRMMPFSSTTGRYLGFQFPATLAAKSRVVKVSNGGIFCVKYSNFRSFPPCSRVVVNTSASLRYSTEWSADKKQVKIDIWKSGYSPALVSNKQVSAAPSASRPNDVKLTVLPPVSSIVTNNNTDAPAAAAEPVAKPKPVAAPLVRLSDESREIYAAMRKVGTSTKTAYRMASARPQITSRVLGMVETKSRLSPVRMAQASAEPVSAEKRVSLNFLGADINDVLKALSLQSGENIVASKDVKGDVTVSLSNVSMEEALDYITKPNGLTYTINNGTYLVAVQTVTAPVVVVAPNVSEVFALHYAKADDVFSILDKLFPEIKRSGNKSSGSSAEGGDAAKKEEQAKVIDFIAVSAPADRMVEIRNVVKQLEESIQTNMASLKTEVYSIKYADAKNIAASIAKLIPGVLVGLIPAPVMAINAPGNVSTTDTGGATVTRGIEQDVPKNPKCRSLVLSGPSEQVARAIALASQLDIKSPMVNIEAKVTSINKSGDEQLGLKWNWGDITFAEGFTDFNKADTTVGADGLNLQNIPRTHNLWDRQPFNFGATLDALVTNGNAKVLASPNLLCLDGMPGVFFVGDEVTYIERIETTATGQNIKTATKQVGVQLRVVGDVSPDGYITLNLHPEVSTLKLNVQQGVTLPILSRRYTDHVIRVKNGQTIAIGGLIRSDEIQEMSKVPLLGDIPFLGKLFQHKSLTKSDTEVVMFITAKIVED